MTKKSILLVTVKEMGARRRVTTGNGRVLTLLAAQNQRDWSSGSQSNPVVDDDVP